MTSQNFEKSAEFDAAMRAFSHLAAKHGLELSTEQKKIFWSGVLYGVRRTRPQRHSHEANEPGDHPQQATVGTTPLLDQATEPDIHHGGAFRL